MLWLLFAFAGPVCWAASTHIDKFLVEKYFKNGSVVVMMVFTSVLAALVLPVIWLFQPSVLMMPPLDAAAMATMGLLDTVALLFYMRALQSDEASDVAPFFQAIPIFGFILAYFVLGETLDARQGLGAALIVTGGAALSVNRRGGRASFNGRLVALMMTCAFVFGLNAVIFKMFALRDDFWTTVFWQGAGQVAFGVIAMLVAKERRRFIAVFKTNSGAVLGVNAVNEVLYLTGNLGAGYAVLFAPVAVVQAFSSATTLFVFIFGIVLTALFPRLGREDLSCANLLRKAAAAVLVTAGAILIGGAAY